MAAFGNLTLLVSFVVATLAGVASWLGIRRDSERLLRAGRAAIYLLATTLAMAIAAMVHAFTSSDFSIKYVQHYSEAGQPFAYKLTSVWGGLDGSLLFWVFLLALCAAIAIKGLWRRERAITDPHSPLEYRINGVVANMPEFSKAFACKPGQAMVRESACRVW